MQLIAAIALTIFYIGISLIIGGVRPQVGIPWWFFTPVIVVFCAAFIADKISAVLPIPWINERQYSSPPRRIHLSWRSALRIPALIPVFIIPYHFYYILRINFDIGWVLNIAVPLIIAALAILALKLRRKIRLLRNGKIATGIIDWHSHAFESFEQQIAYHFMTANGEIIKSKGWDGYDLSEGSEVPVFYDTGNPTNNVAACDCWFEVD